VERKIIILMFKMHSVYVFQSFAHVSPCFATFLQLLLYSLIILNSDFCRNFQFFEKKMTTSALVYLTWNWHFNLDRTAKNILFFCNRINRQKNTFKMTNSLKSTYISLNLPIHCMEQVERGMLCSIKITWDTDCWSRKNKENCIPIYSPYYVT